MSDVSREPKMFTFDKVNGFKKSDIGSPLPQNELLQGITQKGRRHSLRKRKTICATPISLF